MRFKILFFILIFLLCFNHNAFSQEEDKAEESSKETEVITVENIADAMSKGMKKTLVELDAEKAMKRTEKERQTNEKLDSFIKEWINTQSSKRRGRIRRKIEQNWQTLPTTPPQSIDYYIRDFSYSMQNKNIIEANSTIFPYKATVDVKELLYVERAPLMGMPRSEYQYTADTNIRIDLQYYESMGKWQAMGVEDTSVNLEKGWPQEIKRKLTDHFIPLD